MDVIGTAENDVLNGTADDDRLYGKDGMDELYGGAGDDYLVGGEETYFDHNDSIYGDLGNDTLIGGALTDYLYGGPGDDVLDGGTGNDHLYLHDGINLAYGGPGDDTFVLNGGRDTVYGGSGDDNFTFFIGDPAPGQTVLDGGEGNDSITSPWESLSAGTTFLVTGGAGHDLFSLSGYDVDSWPDVHPVVVTITDFTQGEDRIRMSFAQAYDFPGNPFGELGYLRLEQRGADTVIQYDRDGAAGASHGWSDSAVLQGVTLTDLNRDSFEGYLDPGGSSIGGYVAGKDGHEVLWGGPLNDTFLGGDGNDLLAGGPGDDLLIGGDETEQWRSIGDLLYGGFGNDKLLGNSGNDELDGGYGDDHLEGGAGDDDLAGDDGNDFLSGGGGEDILSDGAGNDTFLGGAGNDEITGRGLASGYFDGGDGNDVIRSGGGTDTVLGGAGDDSIYVGLGLGYSGIVTVAPTEVDGGEGADTIHFQFNGENRVVVKGGPGVDTFIPFNAFDAVAELTDFSPGLGGDVIDFSLWDPSWKQYQVNPFGQSGYARALQVGADTVLELDRDGTLGTGYGFEPVFILRGVTVADLTSANFAGVAAHSTPPGLALSGTAGADTLLGGGSADTLDGKAGNDLLEGGAGNDSLNGADGDDTLVGGTGNDNMIGGTGMDLARFDGNFADFSITPGNVTDVRGNGTDTLSGIERLVFDDAHYAFDVGGVGGQVYRLYQAAFNRTPDLAGLGYWIGVGDRGLALEHMSAMFFQSPEFDALYGASQTNEQLVRLFYVNALHRQPDEPGVAYWTKVLDDGLATPAMVLTGFSESAENKQATAAVIGNGFMFDPTYY